MHTRGAHGWDLTCPLCLSQGLTHRGKGAGGKQAVVEKDLTLWVSVNFFPPKCLDILVHPASGFCQIIMREVRRKKDFMVFLRVRRQTTELAGRKRVKREWAGRGEKAEEASGGSSHGGRCLQWVKPGLISWVAGTRNGHHGMQISHGPDTILQAGLSEKLDPSLRDYVVLERGLWSKARSLSLNLFFIDPSGVRLPWWPRR